MQSKHVSCLLDLSAKSAVSGIIQKHWTDRYILKSPFHKHIKRRKKKNNKEAEQLCLVIDFWIKKSKGETKAYPFFTSN